VPRHAGQARIGKDGGDVRDRKTWGHRDSLPGASWPCAGAAVHAQSERTMLAKANPLPGVRMKSG